MKRITVSLPDELVEAAIAATESGSAPSVSAYVARALREQESRRSLSEVLDAWDTELGPPTAADERWAAHVLSGR